MLRLPASQICALATAGSVLVALMLLQRTPQWSWAVATTLAGFCAWLAYEFGREKGWQDRDTTDHAER